LCGNCHDEKHIVNHLDIASFSSLRENKHWLHFPLHQILLQKRLYAWRTIFRWMKSSEHHQKYARSKFSCNPQRTKDIWQNRKDMGGV
jgi:hypothetical protein